MRKSRRKGGKEGIPGENGGPEPKLGAQKGAKGGRKQKG